MMNSEGVKIIIKELISAYRILERHETDSSLQSKYGYLADAFSNLIITIEVKEDDE